MAFFQFVSKLKMLVNDALNHYGLVCFFIFKIYKYFRLMAARSPPFLNLNLNQIQIMEENAMSFYVTIKNSQGQEIRVKVSLEIYELFESERKEQERFRKEQERHGSDEDVEGDIAGYYHSRRTQYVDEQAIQRQEIKTALQIIKDCSPTQQRRFYLNRILGYSFAEIARKESCSEGAVRKSVNEVSSKIKNFMK
jgi:hypothetical protein